MSDFESGDVIECPYCSDTLRIEGKRPAFRIIEVASDCIHACWETNLDLDSLLVTDDRPTVDSE